METLQTIADALQVTVPQLFEQWRKVAVAGYVGAGQQFFPYDDHVPGEGIGDVDAPVALGSVVAVEIRGNSMYPRYRDGEVVLYRKQGDNPLELIGRECIVGLPDGSVFLKELQRGTSPDTFRLVSHNAPPMEDQVIEWAAPVRWRTEKTAVLSKA